MVNANKHFNKLIDEKSPYLLQHAHNPVHWYPWQEEAFAKAKKENKPIFLSIGYSTCHWCHVMAHESFEDESVAQLLNRYFVAIKVDREERPDIDHLYMEFCQALTGSGGWPLTILMTPEKEPFFAGTYFPRIQQFGRAGLTEILERVGSLWSTQESDLRASAREIVSTVQTRHSLAGSENGPLLTGKKDKVLFIQAVRPNQEQDKVEPLIEQAYALLESSFDVRYGGFGQAPKFPSPHTLSFLLRYTITHPDSKALTLVEKTLDGMSQGGLYDHIGFGFSRYSTDDKWLVPHFEKMLYDNALLTIAYIETYQISHRPQDARKAEEILRYVLREMTSQDGGFYSAEDADSEGVEGKFYVWSPEEIALVLGTEQAELFCSAYDITPKGNFEGKSIPNLIQTDWQQLASQKNLDLPNLRQILEESRKALLAAREKRIHPHKDDKILTAWNGLLIAALSKAAQVLDQKIYLMAAEKSLEFILSHLRRSDGRLLARYRDAHAAYPGYLDDYAYLIWGLLELYTASGSPRYLRLAIELQEQQIRLFHDPGGGGYYLTGSDAEELLFRPKELYDGALPSGNSVSALNLLRLARITADPRWDKLAQEQIQAFQQTVSSYPAGCTAFLQALQFAVYGTQELVLAGSLDAPTLPEMRRAFFTGFHPFATLLYQEGSVGDVVAWLNNYPVPEQTTVAYLCQNLACQAPVTTAESLVSLLENPTSYPLPQ